LNFNKNAAQTYLLNSVSNADPKGLVDEEPYANGRALAIENGRVLVIENGIAIC
jgi:hypothetical protein